VAGHILGSKYDGLFGFTLSTWGQTKIHITILFKKIKGFLSFRAISGNLFSVVSESEYKFVMKKSRIFTRVNVLTGAF